MSKKKDAENAAAAVKAMNMPIPVDVIAGVSQYGTTRPNALFLHNAWQKVTRVQDMWMVDEEWWLIPVRRRYYTVELETGATDTLYQDLETLKWFRQRY